MAIPLEERARAVEGVLTGRMTRDEAVRTLGCSKRTICRYIARWRARGAEGLVHGLTGKRSNRAKPEAVRDSVIALYEQQYKGMAVNAFVRDVVSGEGVKLSRETVRKWLIDAGLWVATGRGDPILP